MKKQYQKPELERVLLESAERVTLDLGHASNFFPVVAEDDNDGITPVNL